MALEFENNCCFFSMKFIGEHHWECWGGADCNNLEGRPTFGLHFFNL